MASRFAPLDFPAVLHGLPQNYSHKISLFDGEGNFTPGQHMDRFDDFIDLEEVDYDDAKMRLFTQSLSEEAKRWFKYLPTRFIATFEAFQTLFQIGGKIKKSPLHILSQYKNLEKDNFESVHEFSSIFMRVYNPIPADIKPLVGASKITLC